MGRRRRCRWRPSRLSDRRCNRRRKRQTTGGLTGMCSAAWCGRIAASPLAAMLVIIALTMLVGMPAAAEPFVPADDNAVLETGLPTIDPRMRELRALSRELREHPDDLAAAMRLASGQLAMGVAEADPRFVGYARGTLAPWWQGEAAAPPLPVLAA